MSNQKIPNGDKSDSYCVINNVANREERKTIFARTLWMTVVPGTPTRKTSYDNDKSGNLKSVSFKRKNITDLGTSGTLTYK